MSLLTLVQNASDTIGLARPSAVVSSTDGNVRTLLSLANTEGRELLERYSWPATQIEVTHTTLAAELQGVMTTIAPGFGYIINDTFWDRDGAGPIFLCELKQQPPLKMLHTFHPCTSLRAW